MDHLRQEEIRQKINAKLAEIENELVILKHHTQPEALDSAIGRISRMDYINNRAINEAQIKKNEAKLRGLHNWLGKLGTSDFGKCIRCGHEININRLLFMPESNYCIRCAKWTEKKDWSVSQRWFSENTTNHALQIQFWNACQFLIPRGSRQTSWIGRSCNFCHILCRIWTPVPLYWLSESWNWKYPEKSDHLRDTRWIGNSPQNSKEKSPCWTHEPWMSWIDKWHPILISTFRRVCR